MEPTRHVLWSSEKKHTQAQGRYQPEMAAMCTEKGEKPIDFPVFRLSCFISYNWNTIIMYILMCQMFHCYSGIKRKWFNSNKKTNTGCLLTAAVSEFSLLISHMLKPKIGLLAVTGGVVLFFKNVTKAINTSSFPPIIVPVRPQRSRDPKPAKAL